MNMMADARFPTLKTQAADAALSHLQFEGRLTPQQLAQIQTFENRVYSAQTRSNTAGSLIEPDGPTAGLGLRSMRHRAAAIGGALSLTTGPTGTAVEVVLRP